MSDLINQQIVDNFELFETAFSDRKVVRSNSISLLPNPRHQTRYMNIEPASHPALTHLEIVVDCHISNPCIYGIKLISKDLCAQPFFRFESKGVAHRNKNPNHPLYKRSIPTPHFHSFDADGYLMAYKTPALDTTTDIHDINVGMELFCQSSNTFSESGSVPLINITGASSTVIIDPLEGFQP